MERFVGTLRVRLPLALISTVVAIGLLGVCHVRAANEGLPFLRIGIGARAATIGGLGVLADDGFAVFYNPAALAGARRWGWGVGYSRWFADTYDASFFVHRHFNWLGSRKTYAAIGLRYFGSPTWDSTDGVAPAVSASHTVGQLALGQRLDWEKLRFLRRHVALGVSIRAIRSQLAGYSGLSLSTDAGGVLRLGRFGVGPLGFGIFRYADIQVGAVLGNALGFNRAFETTKTRLPRNWSAAVSLRLAMHSRWEALLSYQYFREWGADAERIVGAELVWNRLLALRFGYRPDDPLSKFTFGFGVVAEGLRVGFPSFVGLRNSHVCFDFAGGEYGPVLGWTQRTAVAHYPTGPEPFAMLSPLEEAIVDGPSVRFEWEAAEDPDLADELEYVLAVDPDAERVRSAVKRLEAGDLKAAILDSLLLFTKVEGTRLDTAVAPVGTVFYWTVAAVDLDGHVRVGHGSPQVRRFRVRWPDLLVESIRLEPTPWLTGRDNSEQGELVVRVRNVGDRSADAYSVQVKWVCLDSLGLSVQEVDTLLWRTSADSLKRLFGGGLEDRRAESIDVGVAKELRFEWKTSVPGRYRVLVAVAAEKDGKGEEVERANNRRFETVVTVPKWAEPEPFRMPAKDKFKVSIIRYKTIAVPLVPMVFFDAGDSSVSPSYLRGDVVPAVLEAIADRMKATPGAVVTLQGYVDRVSERGYGAELAYARARAVKRTLVELGVDPDRVRISRSHNVFHRRIQRRARTEQDRIWIGEENRRVELVTEPRFEKALFGPVELRVQPMIAERDPRTERPEFDVRVLSASEIQSWIVEILQGDRVIARVPARVEPPAQVVATRAYWDGKCADGTAPPAGSTLLCRVRVTDELGREFVTRTQEFSLVEVASVVREEIFALFKFADVEVPFRFYLDQLGPIARQIAGSDELRVRFEGHADATGPEEENLRLSRDRAREITDAFRRILRQKYPGRYARLVSRVDPPRWFGESVPLVINLAGQRELLLGSNSDPIGRNRNRRVMILVYRERPVRGAEN